MEDTKDSHYCTSNSEQILSFDISLEEEDDKITDLSDKTVVSPNKPEFKSHIQGNSLIKLRRGTTLVSMKQTP